MFKHKQEPMPAESAASKSDSESAVATQPLAATHEKSLKDTSPAALRDLLEKNLKWSQIIYEQNRRINSKLFWSTLGSWFKIIIFFVLLGGSLLFLSPFFRPFFNYYNSFARQAKFGEITPTSSLQNALQFLPLDTAQKEQLKTFLK